MTVGLQKISYIFKKILKDILYLELGFSTNGHSPIVINENTFWVGRGQFVKSK